MRRTTKLKASCFLAGLMLVAPSVSARIVTATYSGTVMEVTDDPSANYFFSSDLGTAFSVTFTYD